MKTIQVTVEESLLAEFDQVAKELKTSRSVLICEAMRDLLRQRRIRQMEERDRLSYEKYPQQLDELILHQVWEDDGEDWSQYYDAE